MDSGILPSEPSLWLQTSILFLFPAFLFRLRFPLVFNSSSSSLPYLFVFPHNRFRTSTLMFPLCHVCGSQQFPSPFALRYVSPSLLYCASMPCMFSRNVSLAVYYLLSSRYPPTSSCASLTSSAAANARCTTTQLPPAFKHCHAAQPLKAPHHITACDPSNASTGISIANQYRTPIPVYRHHSQNRFPVATRLSSYSSAVLLFNVDDTLDASLMFSIYFHVANSAVPPIPAWPYPSVSP